MEIILNLLQQSNSTPNVSAYAHLSGPFDYNKMPLAPMGCAAQIRLVNLKGHISVLAGEKRPTGQTNPEKEAMLRKIDLHFFFSL
jgi:hypothetical protein